MIQPMVYPLILSFLLMIPLFFVIHDLVITTSEFNSDLARIKQWDFQWKINFNPDIYNQAQEVMSLRHHRKNI